eukprot:JP438619.1.p1 GENE.JP438619.1~~JP438619.1.p1  ORF type:complete len:110 (+),score=10.73 JP438619.1:97-426(+)
MQMSPWPLVLAQNNNVYVDCKDQYVGGCWPKTTKLTLKAKNTMLVGAGPKQTELSLNAKNDMASDNTNIAFWVILVIDVTAVADTCMVVAYDTNVLIDTSRASQREQLI